MPAMTIEEEAAVARGECKRLLTGIYAYIVYQPSLLRYTCLAQQLSSTSTGMQEAPEIVLLVQVQMK